jgi:Flp pilus assembly protein TadD
LTGGGAGAGPDGRPFSNRDAIGARVTVETDQLRRIKFVQAGSGFLSQHSKELLFGIGASQRVVKVTVEWPSGRRQELADVALNHRVKVRETGEVTSEPFSAAPPLPIDPGAKGGASLPSATWLYEPFPGSDFTLRDLRGGVWSLPALRGSPAVLLAWAAEAPPSRDALLSLDRAYRSLSEAGIKALALAFDRPEDADKVRAAAQAVGSLPVAIATPDVALAWSILHRHLFIGRPDLQLPTVFLLDTQGRVVRVCRGPVDAQQIVRDAAAVEVTPEVRLARGRPFAGTSTMMPGPRDTVPYGRDLLDQGLESQALVAFEMAAQGNPSSSVLYRLGNLLAKKGETVKATIAYERALELEPDLAEASNDLGTLLAEAGDLRGAVARFRAALEAAPDYPDALNNLGYAMLLSGQETEAQQLYEKALALQPDLPEALNNLGLIRGRHGDMDGAYALFKRALDARRDYGDAANNLALVLVSRGDMDGAITMLRQFIDANPDSENTYVTLAKAYLAAGRREEALAVLTQLLDKHPDNAAARELQQRFR